ncbi:MAG: AAA family ATPase [Nanoarchaeota archaeon]|nr:AAA family ATPase [Nanoarchaeota archaeon]MBU1321741.1 AAA family ATPase [Nanoarchaeota archaeon]MBU1597707.1 AAA family ATPase [Nanoarchaeota archaeon]MBU2442299.1 AAA family ATPase [Nanoarchaeota archaeon]
MVSRNELKRSFFSYTSSSNETEEENRLLKETLSQLREEVERYRSPALMLAEVLDVMDGGALISLPNGNKFMVQMSGNITSLIPGESVLVEQRNLTVVKKIVSSKHFNVERFVIIEKPNLKWSEIGGLEEQMREIKEVIELPLKSPELFEKVGIQPPKGILLHGPPGTGKTLLAKAVASSTKSTFIEIVGSELVQKFIGEGAKLVKEIFELARQKAPSIVFIDEIDALAARRVDVGTSGEREVQRTFMQFLAEIDGFKPLSNVKIIGCTNRMDILDPAVIRPGRLDRLIEVPVPNEQGLKEIFKIHSKNMTLDRKIKKDALLKKMKGFSGAEVKAVCTEAGYFAIRSKRTKVVHHDFLCAIDKVNKEEVSEDGFSAMFG